MPPFTINHYKCIKIYKSVADVAFLLNCHSFSKIQGGSIEIVRHTPRNFSQSLIIQSCCVKENNGLEILQFVLSLHNIIICFLFFVVKRRSLLFRLKVASINLMQSWRCIKNFVNSPRKYCFVIHFIFYSTKIHNFIRFSLMYSRPLSQE